MQRVSLKILAGLVLTLVLAAGGCAKQVPQPPAAGQAAAPAGLSARANAGDVKAQLALAGQYLAGQGVPRDFAKARALYEKAAGAGSNLARVALGAMYENGNGVPRDYKKAYAWYLNAARAGDAEGQWEVGRCHYDGLGVDPSANQAMEWWRKAADQGHPRANFSVMHGYPWYEDAE